MPTHEQDYVECVLNSPYGVDSPFDDYFDEEKAVDEYIDRCMGICRTTDY